MRAPRKRSGGLPRSVSVIAIRHRFQPFEGLHGLAKVAEIRIRNREEVASAWMLEAPTITSQSPPWNARFE
jgi:hypothetical protein